MQTPTASLFGPRNGAWTAKEIPGVLVALRTAPADEQTASDHVGKAFAAV
jgi:hypothetical protein